MGDVPLCLLLISPGLFILVLSGFMAYTDDLRDRYGDE